MAQGPAGKIVLFDDFMGGANVAVAGTVAAPLTVGNGTFKLIGDGIDETDSGAVFQAAHNGVIRLTCTNETAHTAALATNVAFDLEKNGHVIVEARMAIVAQASARAFIGLSGTAGDTLGIIFSGSTTTLTLTAANAAMLMFDDGLTSKAWHAIHNGGSTAHGTVSTPAASNVTPVNTEFDVLRVEAFRDGTVEWWLNGERVRRVVGALSATADLAAVVGVQSTTTATKSLDVDYMSVNGNRNWARSND